MLVMPASSLAAQASPVVSPDDPAYRDLDALVSAGLVRSMLTENRTLSRADFARFVREAEANEAQANERARRPRFQEALERLQARFAADMQALCDGQDQGCTRPVSNVRVSEAEVDVTGARSPSRRIPTSYRNQPGLSIADNIDADLNPLLQQRLGRVYADHGWTGAAEAQADAQLGPALVAGVGVRAWAVSENGVGTSGDAALRRGYLRAVLGNWALQAGRDYVTRGQGHAGGTLFSDNPRALDMVRVSNERPFRLPGALSGIGLFQAYAFLGDLGPNRDVPHAKVVSFGWDWRPSRYFEGGAALEAVEGGQGGPAASFGERVKDIAFWIFGQSSQDLPISDKVVNVNGRLTIPSAGLDLYLDLSSTDINGGRWETLGDEAAWLLGGRLSGLGQGGRYDVWSEFHRTGVRPYTHHEFTSGQTLDSLVLGDAAGPMTTAWHLGVDRRGEDQTLGLGLAWERHRGDLYQPNGEDGNSYRWIRVADNPDEIRVRATLDWVREGGGSGRFTQVSVGYEHVTRFDFTSRGLNNLMAQVRVGIRR